MEAIDIVYTWVDGSQPEWQARRRAALGEASGAMTWDAVTPNRTLDREELRYSLRSVALHAPWVRHIHIVTAQQRPAWLAPSARITIVDQDMLFPDRRHTPTFNSQAIESHLDRISDLSERFLYLNDDVFFMRAVRPDDYFDPAGRPRISFALTRRRARWAQGRYAETPTGAPLPADNGFVSAWKNNSRLLDEAFGARRRFLPSHHALPTTRSIVREARTIFAAAFEAVSASRFRAPHDIAPLGLATHVGLHTGMATDSGAVEGTVVHYVDSLLRNAVALWLIAAHHQTLCLNDDTRAVPGSLRCALVSRQIRRALERRFPTPAAWEIPTAR